MGDHKTNPVALAANQPRVQFGRQLGYFCGRNVAITHAIATAGHELNQSRGLLKNITDGGAMLLQLNGCHKLIMLGTIYSIEEAGVAQEMMAI